MVDNNTSRTRLGTVCPFCIHRSGWRDLIKIASRYSSCTMDLPLAKVENWSQTLLATLFRRDGEDFKCFVMAVSALDNRNASRSTFRGLPCFFLTGSAPQQLFPGIMYTLHQTFWHMLFDSLFPGAESFCQRMCIHSHT